MAGADHHRGAAVAWIAVAIILVAFVIGGVAVVISNWTVFGIAVGLVVVGGIIGKVGTMVRGGVPPR